MTQHGGPPLRLLIDVSHVRATPHYTGIQRYVRHTLRHAAALAGPAAGAGMAPGDLSVGAIAAGSGGCWYAVDTLPPHPLEGLPSPQVLSAPMDSEEDFLQPGTHVLLADRFWHTGAWAALDALLASPAAITLVVYDLISLRRPEWFAAGVDERFRHYLRQVLPRAQQVVCLSAAVRRDVREWMAAEGIPAPPILVVPPGHQVWSPPMAAAAVSGAQSRPPEGIPRAWTLGGARFVLQVGTLEPRKNHRLAWQAMQQLWRAGRTEGLLVIGQPGWLTDDFCQTLRRACAHTGSPAAPVVVWLGECTDSALDWCYRHAAAVLYPSSHEGYGLPLAEAAASGTPVVAHDTPVHREVAARAGGRVSWTSLDPTVLAEALALALDAQDVPFSPVPPRSWAQATGELVLAMRRASAYDPADLQA
ncbi:MAG: glycosyltransferase family 1 protein [Pseudomonadota bacterium]